MAVNGFDNDQTRSFTNLAAGTKVSHYKIISKIGAGGMGEVYLAEDTKLDRVVALKFLSVFLSQDVDQRKRFAREAQAAARLGHANIVAIYEVGEYQGRPWFSMENVDGTSLEHLIELGTISEDRIIELAMGICHGLRKAHEAGVTHRDIKPSNILVDSDGCPRVLDFGLAVVRGSDKLTQDGSMLGTVGYMSPEQVEGREVDPRSDLFSFGVVLYELLSERNPFRRNSQAATFKAILQDDPQPITRDQSRITDGLQHIVFKLLQKRQKDRYQSAADVIEDLRQLRRGLEPGQPTEIRLPSIAVLPFTNLSADPEQEYFCDGMAEEIINALTHVEGLRVVARTSCFAFKGKHIDIREIGRKLNVDNVLEGSVRKAGSRVRITGQLIKISDGYHLWSDRYDRELSDIFEVQDEISIAIVEKLKVKLLGGERQQIVKRPTDNLQAYSLYLMGRYHWNNRSPKETEKAIECLKKAVDLDPGFSLGHAGLADAYVIQIDDTTVYERRLALHALAEKSVFKALELDDSLAEARTALAHIRYQQWQWDEAEEGFLQAIKLNPRYATAHHWYSFFLAGKGKLAQSWEHIEVARELDPLSLVIIAAQAFICYLMGQHDKALEICREGIELNADFPLYSYIAGWSLQEKGSHDEAIRQFQRTMRLAAQETPGGGGDPLGCTPHIGRSYAMLGECDKAKQILEDTIKKTKDQHVLHNPIASLCFAVGEMDRGFEWLERSVEEKAFWLPLARVMPFFDSVRNDPRFLSIIRRIGLDQDVQEIPHD